MKHLIYFFLVMFFWLSSTSSVEASIVTVSASGDLKLNVLSYQDSTTLTPKKPTSLEVKKVNDSIGVPSNPQVELKTDNGKVLLSVNNGSQTNSMDVSEIKDTLVEIEQQNAAEKVEIGVENETFIIKQQDMVATTGFPITISPKEKTLSVATDTGLQYVTMLPRDAVETVMRPKLITSVPGNKIELVNRGNEGLTYAIPGEKVIVPFNLFSYKFPVTAFVSASNGELVQIEQPNWFRVIGFLFS